jgi:choline dehydrogenase-like flavoprotein
MWLSKHMEEYDFQWSGRRPQEHFIGYAAPGAWWGGDVGVLVRAAQKEDVEIIYNAEARELILDEYQRKVEGVEAVIENNRVNITGNAVVIASGAVVSAMVYLRKSTGSKIWHN